MHRAEIWCAPERLGLPWVAALDPKSRHCETRGEAWKQIRMNTILATPCRYSVWLGFFSNTSTATCTGKNTANKQVQRGPVWRFGLIWVVLVLACSGCATQAGLSTSDVEAVAKGDRVALLVLGTGNKWAPRTEPDLYMVVQAPRPTPTEKVQTDLSECRTVARTVWNSDRAERDRTTLVNQGPAYNPGAHVSRAVMDLLAKTYGDCLQPKGYMASRPEPRD